MSTKKYNKIHIPRWNELPNIALYLDQILTFIDQSLSDIITTEKDSHILTKTMINNYVKHHVIAPPNNKKYSKEHIAQLIVITILKQIYSISDISNFIATATSKSKTPIAYDKFCDELENAISFVFEGTVFKTCNITNSDILIIRNIAFSLANKMFIDKVHFNR